MKQAIISFTKGMNTDFDYSVFSKGMYKYSSNFRLGNQAAGVSGNVGALETVQGNYVVIGNILGEEGVILGQTNVREWTVLFVKLPTHDAIYKIKFSSDGESIPEFIEIFSDFGKEERLGFDINHRIIAVGRHETSTISKVYWVDGLNPIRYINLDKNYATLPTSSLSIVPSQETFASIEILGTIEGGNYTSGSVQYYYQLYSKNAAASSFIGPSDIVKLSTEPLTVVGGSPKDEDTNKAVSFRIFNIDNIVYNRVRVVSVHYTTNKGIPNIGVVFEGEAVANTLSIIDTGNIIVPLTLEEFSSFALLSYVPATLETKDNILFASNVSESGFKSLDLEDWDARAYRFSNAASISGGGVVTVLQGLIAENINASLTGKYIRITPTGSWTEYNNQSIVDSGLDWSIPLTHNCITPYNKLSPVPGSEESYKHQADRITLGGEGKNIKYSFTEKIVLHAKLTSSGQSQASAQTGDKSQITKETVTTTTGQAGEVYRTGIVFYNKQGQVSFVKWIGDIKFPTYGELRVGQNTPKAHSDQTHYNNIILKVEIKNWPQDENIVGCQIVRVVRDYKDRSILISGIVSSSDKHNNDDYFRSGTYTLNTAGLTSNPNMSFPMIPYQIKVPTGADKVVEFYSPETVFTTTDFTKNASEMILEVDTVLSSPIYREGMIASGGRLHTVENGFTVTNFFFSYALKLTKLAPLPASYTSIKYNIEDLAKVLPNYGENDVLTLGYKNVVELGRQYTEEYPGCTKIIMTLTEGLHSKLSTNTVGYITSGGVVYPSVAVADPGILYGKLKKNVDTTRYGGITYAARFLNEYIPFSKIVNKASSGNTSAECIFNDTFISPFKFIRGLYKPIAGNPWKVQQVVAFPVESSIDIKYRGDKIYDNTEYPPKSGDITTMVLQETVEKGVEIQPLIYDTEIGNLYTYNSAYSVQPDVQKFYPAPFDFVDYSTNDVKVVASEKKSNGENLDSWTIFKPANFIEVDTKYGGIKALRTVGDKLMFWQDKAFGVLSVNDRALIADNNPGQLSLGTGGVLERYDYISTEIGCSDNISICSTENGVYWYDKINHQLLEFTSKLKYLDLEKGMKSYLRSKIDPGAGKVVGEVVVEVDPYNKEVIFAFPGETSLIYSQLIEGFLGEHSYNPYSLFRDNQNRLYSIPMNPKTLIYRHNSDKVDRAQFYGAEPSESVLEVVVNEEYDSVKVFDNIEFVSKSLSSSGLEIFGDTFTTFQAYNTKQNTGEYNLVKRTPANILEMEITKRERSWTAAIPRNNVVTYESTATDILDETNLDRTRTFKERMRDNYLIVRLKYSNGSGNYLSIPYVKISYRNSIR